ncbi:MAG: type IV pili methyl-accepting chemotaxis transducer N-terminal domain-containing protein [Lewinellaceae bacterium]|nr:type IV pili methyl-accepting chemotaxis transducer N-terminal domain-containing protein [Saprospiraceae bacterium]MCB9337813.1 type IV pili methyl-accepting chemotaxis transducer N-terminal domain-containing protein [Lewinellaceae bacterium]
MKGSTPLIFYLLAISLLVLSSTLAYLLARQGLEDRENDARVVNLAGRQRMLSQRIAKDCLKLQGNSAGSPEQREILDSLDRSLQEWQQAYLQLRGKTPIGDFTVQNSDEVNRLFDNTEQTFQAIKNAAIQLLKKQGSNSQEAMGAILENEPVFLGNMDAIVLRYQNESTTKIKQLGQLETFIWLFTLLLLGLELSFIFIPLHRRINRAMEDKIEQNQLLLEKQQALENSLAQMQQMQQYLLEAEKLATLGETVGVITHEINTPIGIAVTAASSLQEYTQGFVVQYEQQQLRKSSLEAYVGQAQKGCNLILGNLEKAAQLLQDYKTVAVRQLSRQQERFDLSELIRQVANTLGPYFKNTEIELQLDLPERFEIDSHPGIFAQVLTNLVTNSLRHGYPDKTKKGTIAIRLVPAPDHFILQHQDDGTGIPADLLPQIFEPFFSTGKQKGGSGLGLSIVQNLVVKQLGGTISCQSEINQGVLFDINIPI